ncbi:hypothetical protein [Lactobacillus crispatus]|uniref:hypothetical protein n=1 Tax=Lactobacillus crispatus TaxID=47770 RepID=UPI0030F8332C
MNKIDFEEARNKLQMIEEMLNRMPLIHGENDVFKVTADEMDDFLAMKNICKQLHCIYL